jgi:hypothetical protein
MPLSFVFRCTALLLLSSVVRAGDIEGFVKFPGETPPPAMIANGVDAACPRGIGGNNLIVRQENRGLKNALVVVEYTGDAPAGRAVATGLKAEKCVFLPRMQWTRSPAYLTLTNLTDTNQDARATIEGVRVFAVDISGRGASIRRPLSRAKLYRVDSELHPWMRAWIYASPHPYVAVTDEQGHFVIHDAPAGKWTIHAWHEGWQIKGKDNVGRVEFQPEEETRTVRVPSEGHVEVIFEGLAPTFI